MHKVTIETDTQIITGNFLSIEATYSDNRLDYTLQNMHDVSQKTKTFEWRFCYEKNTSDLISCLNTYDNEKSAKQRLKWALHKNAYQAVSYDGEVLVVPKGKFYIMKVEK